MKVFRIIQDFRIFYLGFFDQFSSNFVYFDIGKECFGVGDGLISSKKYRIMALDVNFFYFGSLS